MRNQFVGHFVIKKLHGSNAVEVLLSGPIANKHPTFPISLIKKYERSDEELFPNKIQSKEVDPPVESDGSKVIHKVMRERIILQNGQRIHQYLVKYEGNDIDTVSPRALTRLPS